MRNHDDSNIATQGKLPIFTGSGRALGKACFRNLTDDEFKQARLYAFMNCDEVLPFVDIRDAHVGRIRAIDFERSHNENFAGWFDMHIRKMKEQGQVVNEQLVVLSFGPSRSVCCYKGYVVNGFRFHTKERERIRKTQNNGVFVNAETHSFASAKDTNPVRGNVGYYGVLHDVVDLKYINENQTILFKCHWWDVLSHARIKQDDYGFTSLNFNRTLGTNKPFVVATQAQQVFYVQDNLDED